MADQSKIEWTDATWNPVTGCTKISSGCRHCYAERMAARLQAMGQPLYRQGFKVAMHESELDRPRRWKKPRRIFVCSMGDLFHPAVNAEFIRRVFQTMQACPQHTFMVLTKRPERASGVDLSNTISPWPLPNVWMGTSCENQAAANERIPHLLKCSAAVRFVSCEPLLGPISFCEVCRSMRGPCWCGAHIPSVNGLPIERRPWPLHWIICGGESGPQARPMHPHWARSIRDQCQGSGVPFFFKQCGEWLPSCDYYDANDVAKDDALSRPHRLLTRGGQDWNVGRLGTDDQHDGQPPPDTWIMHRVGKKKAGRLLDEMEWDEMPGRKDA